MKRLLTLLLAAALCLCLAAPALAAPEVVPSGQALSVNGEAIECEKYNIDGENYFKLRDLAWLLRGTLARFSVDYDFPTNTVTVLTGEAYAPLGTELDLSGGDMSETAVPTKQTIVVDGAELSGLRVYNIGGANYFRLRDLGDCLGFAVDYDEGSRTVLVSSPSRLVWKPVSTAVTRVYADGSVEERLFRTCYDERGRVLSEEGEGWRYIDYVYSGDGLSFSRVEVVQDAFGAEESALVERTVDEQGRLLRVSRDGQETIYTYDEAGNLIRQRSEQGGEVYEAVRSYDASGHLLTSSDSSGKEGRYIYDERGCCLSHTESVGGEVCLVEAWSYDDAGRVLTETVGTAERTKTEKTWRYTDTGGGYTADWSALDAAGNASGGTMWIDASGNLLREQADFGSWGYDTSYYRIYDERGTLTALETVTDGQTRRLETWSYDGEGNLTSTDVTAFAADGSTELFNCTSYTYQAFPAE